MNGQVYCDYAATAPLRPEVQAALAEAGRLEGNPSSIHRAGQTAKVHLERARSSIAAALGVEPREIIFTSGGTEANNTVFAGLLQPGDHVVTSAIEHPCVHRPLERLAKFGITFSAVAPDASGAVRPGDLEQALRPETRLISLMAVNNETGVINDLAGVGELAAQHNILFHTDAVQAFGKMPLNATELGVHFLAASAHKIGGPKGMGLLLARSGTPFTPLLAGGSQENSHRGGTENLAGAIGFAKALELALAEQAELHQRQSGIRKAFLATLDRNAVHYRVNGKGAYPGVINIHLPGIGGQAMVMNMDAEGFAISYGSSCASGTAEPSHVLLAMGLTEHQAAESVRFSFGYGSTETQAKDAAAAVSRVVARMGQPAAEPALP